MKPSRSLWRAVLVAGLLTTFAVASPAASAAPAQTAPAQKAPAQKAPAQTAAAMLGQDVRVPAGFVSWAEVMNLQERMNRVAERIAAAAKADPRSGYAGVVADPLNRELHVYWKGRPPADLATLAGSTVPVRVLPAAYTRRELAAAADRLLEREGDRITQIGPRADGAGLLVGTAGTKIAASRQAGVAVTLSTDVSPTSSTRVNDAPPWSGGARWANQTRGGGCSTGFAVRHGGANRMLSAAHCGALSDVAVDPTGQRIGTVRADVNGNDVLVIDGNSQAQIYLNTMTADGRVVTEFTSRVVGQTSSQAGNRVCSSGSFSGSRCNIEVVATDQCVTFGDIGRVCGQVQADQRSRTNAGGQGDSGGPVILSPTDLSRVTAVGTVTGRDDGAAPATCTGYVTGDRLCSWRLYYEDIATGLRAVGATLVTG